MFKTVSHSPPEWQKVGRYGAPGTLLHCWWESTWENCPYLPKLNRCLSCDPTIPLRCTWPREVNTHIHQNPRWAFFKKPKTGNNPMSSIKWMCQVQYNCTMEYYTATNKVWVSPTWCWSKKPESGRGHTTWFHFCEVQRKAKLIYGDESQMGMDQQHCSGKPSGGDVQKSVLSSTTVISQR